MEVINMFDYTNQLIGLAGRAEVGKDTAARVLIEVLDLRPYAFAKPITLRCAKFLNMAHVDFLSLPKNSLVIDNLTKRQLMQHVGMELRSKNEYFAIQNLKFRIDLNKQDRYLFNGHLITDVRLPIEADYIRNNGGILIHIKNPNVKPAPRDITEQDLNILKGEKILTNDTTLENFERDVQIYAEQLYKKFIRKTA